jgi:hypothetical protein
MLKLNFFFLLIITSQLYSGTQVNHEQCERKKPFLSKVVRTCAEGFVAAHCGAFYFKNKDLFPISFPTLENLNKKQVIQAIQKTFSGKIPAIQAAVLQYEFMATNKQAVVPAIVILAIGKCISFCVLKKLI